MAHEYRDILFDTPESQIARITLNRPAKLNAYTGRMCEDIVAALDEYVVRDELRCLILTGAGRAFCSGGDVSGEDPDRLRPAISASLPIPQSWATPPASLACCRMKAARGSSRG